MPKKNKVKTNDKCISINKKKYEKELAKLHVELVKLQEWVKNRGLKVVVIFEGRDAAGKGGAPINTMNIGPLFTSSLECKAPE